MQIYTILPFFCLKTAYAGQANFATVIAKDVPEEHRQEALEAIENVEVADDKDDISDGFRSLFSTHNTLKIKQSSSNNSNKIKLDTIADYGCWCRSAADANNLALGSPVDEVDYACRAYTVGNRCLSRDHPNCDIQNLDFTPYLRASWSTYLTFYCSENLDADPITGITPTFDQCSYDVCLVELQGLNDQINALKEHGLSQQYKHSEGFIPSRDNCSSGSPNNGGQHVSPNACCGDFPYRTEYYDGGHKQCCEISGLFYSVLTSDCCTDGAVRPHGQC